MLLLFVCLIGLLMVGTPAFVAIGGASLAYMLVNGLNPLMAVQRMISGVDSFTLLAVPFFILMGGMMNAAQVTSKLFNFANSMVAHWRGGLGHVNVYGSIIFSMMSGSAMADAAGLGRIQLAAMKERGYDPGFAVGTTVATSILAGIIPPSIALVMYGFVANVSIGRLFLAAIVPGLLCAALLHIAIVVYALFRKMPSEEKHSWTLRGKALLESAPVLFMPVLIVGSIAGGIATPTEAAALASLYALFLGVGVYRTISFKLLSKVFVDTFELTGTIMIMVAASMLFGWILVYENVTRDFGQFIITLATEPWQFMLIAAFFMFICGLFLDNIVVILIATPILLPTALQYDIDPVQFGIMTVLTVMIGMLTPPIGMVLFIISKIADMPYMKTFTASIPFIIPFVFVILLVIVVPQVTSFLPDFF